MRIKLDENLPLALIPILRAEAHDVESVRDEGLTGKAIPSFGLRLKTSRDSLLPRTWTSRTYVRSGQELIMEFYWCDCIIQVAAN